MISSGRRHSQFGERFGLRVALAARPGSSASVFFVRLEKPAGGQAASATQTPVKNQKTALD
jgi:hypothetical protein